MHRPKRGVEVEIVFSGLSVTQFSLPSFRIGWVKAADSAERTTMICGVSEGRQQ